MAAYKWPVLAVAALLLLAGLLYTSSQLHVTAAVFHATLTVTTTELPMFPRNPNPGPVSKDIFGQWRAVRMDREEVEDDEEDKEEPAGNKTRKYAVFSASTPSSNSSDKYNYIFDLPLTVLAWRRLRFVSMVIIAGSEEAWSRDPVLSLVLEYLRDLKALVTFLPTTAEHVTMLSQTSRLFSCCLGQKLQDEDVMVLSDADLWPLNGESYVLPADKELLSLNAYCCGYFTHKGGKYRMLPIANLGATVKVWKEIMHPRSDPVSPGSILRYFEEEVGSVGLQKVVKGENEGWFMDQHVVSIRIEEWRRRRNSTTVLFVDRRHGDRLDRSSWYPRRLGTLVDSHLLENLFEGQQWVKVQPLLIFMYGEGTTHLRLCQRYREDFMEALSRAETKPTVHSKS